MNTELKEGKLREWANMARECAGVRLGRNAVWLSQNGRRYLTWELLVPPSAPEDLPGVEQLSISFALEDHEVEEPQFLETMQDRWSMAVQQLWETAMKDIVERNMAALERAALAEQI